MKRIIFAVSLLMSILGQPALAGKLRQFTGYEKVGALGDALYNTSYARRKFVHNGITLYIDSVNCVEYAIGSVNPAPTRNVSCTVTAGNLKDDLDPVLSMTFIDALSNLGVLKDGQLGKYVVTVHQLSCEYRKDLELTNTPSCRVLAKWTSASP